MLPLFASRLSVLEPYFPFYSRICLITCNRASFRSQSSMFSDLLSCKGSLLEVHFCNHSTINKSLHLWPYYLSCFSISQSDILLGAEMQ